MKISIEFKERVSKSSSLKEIEDIRVEYFGKKGLFTSIMSDLKNCDPQERASKGKELNAIKQDMLESFNSKKSSLEAIEFQKRLKKERIDISLPSRKVSEGSYHPINIIIDKVKNVFSRLGFSIVDGPEIESVDRNFNFLNVPEDHPSRNFSDTFYFSSSELLRTQTTTVQVRCLEEKEPPMMIISYGKVYRPDYDATHTPMFHQLEGIALAKDFSFANLKYILEQFIKELFSEDTKVRFRPHFFPFTEPSAELDMSCPSCGGKGCSICKHSGWIEILGCGVISPEVLKNFGYTLDDYVGFAFGMGVERLAMIKYGIKDIRMLYDNDLRLLGQFK